MSPQELSIDAAEHRPILKSKGAVRILVIFQDRPMFSHIIQKVLSRAFHWCGWTKLNSKGLERILIIFQDRPRLYSAILFRRSRRELSINVAVHRSILKNNQNTNYPRFVFTPKTGESSLKQKFRFYCVPLVPGHQALYRFLQSEKRKLSGSREERDSGHLT